MKISEKESKDQFLDMIQIVEETTKFLEGKVNSVSQAYLVNRILILLLSQMNHDVEKNMSEKQKEVGDTFIEEVRKFMFGSSNGS